MRLLGTLVDYFVVLHGVAFGQIKQQLCTKHWTDTKKNILRGHDNTCWKPMY